MTVRIVDDSGDGQGRSVARFSRAALAHWRDPSPCDRTAGGYVAPGSSIGVPCALCRAGWALDEHPEWGEVLPTGWKDLVDVAGHDPRLKGDTFRSAMKRAIRRGTGA